MFFLSFLSLNSCVALFGPSAKGELEAAQKSQDEGSLKKLCEDESLGDPKSYGYPAKATVREMKQLDANRKVRREACSAWHALDSERDTGDCTKLAGKYKHAARSIVDDEVGFYAKWGGRFAKCGDYAFVFENIAQQSNGILEKLEAEGLPMQAEFIKYAQTHEGSRFLPVDHADLAVQGHLDFSSKRLASWLVKKKAFGHCSTLAKALEGASPGVRAAALPYFVEAKCGQAGASIGVDLLTTKDGEHRRLACTNLGDMGDAETAKKVKILAETDGYSITGTDPNTGVPYEEWPVRKACKQAYGKILLRAK